LFHQFGVKLDGVYDIQIAHSLYEKKIKWEQKKRTALKNIASTHLPKSSLLTTFLQTKREMQRQHEVNPDIWSKRPLQQLQINYACGDVHFLFPLYKVLTSILTTTSDRQYLARGNKAQLNEYRAAAALPETYGLI